MSELGFNSQQQRIITLAKSIVLKPKIERSVILAEMTALNQKLTTDQQIQIVQAIKEAPALRFLSATGIRGDAHRLLFSNIAALEGS